MQNIAPIDRRSFMGLTSLAFSGLALSGCATSSLSRSSIAAGYGLWIGVEKGPR